MHGDPVGVDHLEGHLTGDHGVTRTPSDWHRCRRILQGEGKGHGIGTFVDLDGGDEPARPNFNSLSVSGST